MKKKILCAATITCAAFAMSACSGQKNTADVTTSSSLEETTAVTAESITADINALNTKRPDTLGTIKLAEYKDLTVSVPALNEITDEDVNAQIKAKLYEYRQSADTVQDGDYTKINYVGKIDGEAFDGGSAEDYDLEIGSGVFIDGFETGMIGMKSGETKDLTLTFPDDYFDEDKAGKEVIFTVTVNNIERVPELTDEIAKELDAECDSADNYRVKVKEELSQYSNESYEQEKGYQALSDIKELSDVVATDEAIEWAENLLVADYYVPAFEVYYGGSFADVLAAQNTSLADFKENLHDSAKELVEDLLICDAIAEKEGIEVTDATREEYAEAIGTTASELSDAFGQEYTDINVKEYAVFKALNDLCVFVYYTASN